MVLSEAFVAWHDAGMNDNDRPSPTTTAIRAPAPAPAWDLRVPADLDALDRDSRFLETAFSETFSDEQMADWRLTVEPDRWIVAFDGPGGSEPIGSTGACSFRLTVPGGEVGAAGVTGVGVRPDYHRRGILRALMRRQLDDVRARGEPVAVLWASEGAIYQRFGYGLATVKASIDLDRSRSAYARDWPPEGRVRLLDEEAALAAFPSVYEEMRRCTPGALSRSDAWWRSGIVADRPYQRQGTGPKLRYLYEAAGRAEGYAMYRVKDDWDHRGPQSQLEVGELVAVTPRAVRDLWRFLFGVDLVRTIRARALPVPNPLELLLAEPRALAQVVNDGIWLRLVDLPAALGGRRYQRAGSLVIEVADEFCPWNAGRWRLEVGEAGPSKTERWLAAGVDRTDDEPDLVLDTTDLAAAYLGGIRFADLAVTGRVAERWPGAVRRADAMFAADRAPWCTTMF